MFICKLDCIANTAVCMQFGNNVPPVFERGTEGNTVFAKLPPAASTQPLLATPTQEAG